MKIGDVEDWFDRDIYIDSGDSDYWKSMIQSRVALEELYSKHDGSKKTLRVCRNRFAKLIEETREQAVAFNEPMARLQRRISATRLPAAFPLRGGDLDNLVKWAGKSEKYKTDQQEYWKIFRSYTRTLDEIRRGTKKSRPKESAAIAMPKARKMLDAL